MQARLLPAKQLWRLYTQAGFGGAGRRLHDFIRDTLLPHGDATHNVIHNSWEATGTGSTVIAIS